MPLIVLIVGGLLCQLIAPDFAWLYPIPMIATACIIFYYRNYLLALLERSCFFAYIVGVVVFFLWIYLVPVDQALSQHFFQQIESVPLWVSLLWLACRIIGATIIVPIAEELSFRGFLFPHIQVSLVNIFTPSTFFKLSSRQIYLISTSLSLVFTSFLFGVLHSDILAGSLAGLGFGLAYLYRRKCIDAIVAHAVTNGLLAVDAIYFGNWSYW